MHDFFMWFNNEGETEGLLRAALAHLWFLTIHPFADGNGRIARAIADRALAQSEKSEQRFYSMSSQIQRERAEYYRELERTQRGSLDVTAWLRWFLECFTRSVETAASERESVLHQATFWQRHQGVQFNARQRAMLNRLLGNFQGKLTTRKWAAMGKCSPPTAQRDINELLELNILQRNPGGSKNTSYALGESA